MECPSLPLSFVVPKRWSSRTTRLLTTPSELYREQAIFLNTHTIYLKLLSRKKTSH